ncbi:tRNA 5-methoxyuridine(34)/uridine 5-oxyacetic acid(34) synthase CmoB [Thiohalobacter sp. IOR34]|uniref:tRNA 5-methoxyuridine(34)/uridine 5-oxyacetic acid(34) synthase CmoB n=1 Tax=Thiohalobacter sp. IOR34 TaxID=3057176 RepID=UPI0025B25F3F|nr:tRNA 5-methoxyuridine(34)/uridine 5-oxyacetic acid(34) synthase CmoB [Thiohalobacter sp. IOR34]WJW76548.1 tRNA 5-methoxyuridine(34)/uridine 5-oxyacetic acid(34) synthase CmoB [Thiohalobacter sp. IOR34]
MIDYRPLYAALAETPATDWLETLPDQVEARLHPARHGDLTRWAKALASLPEAVPSTVELDRPRPRIGRAADLDGKQRARLEGALRELHPWRKGPFELFGLHIDSEWRSDWKWARLEPHIAPLAGRRVLDVGSGNGYYGWRMIARGAALVVGIDPTLLHLMQYQAVRRYAGHQGLFVLPLALEDLPEKLPAWDSLFSMGVLYHRRSPFDHLLRLREALRPGGELVLETLVIDGGRGEVLVPDGRYARMRNVWFIPSVPELEAWLARCGFRHIRCVDVSPTTPDEQRSTDWMRFESLDRCLDPEDPSLTVEGHPAPRRAILLAERPD